MQFRILASFTFSLPWEKACEKNYDSYKTSWKIYLKRRMKFFAFNDSHTSRYSPLVYVQLYAVDIAAIIPSWEIQSFSWIIFQLLNFNSSFHSTRLLYKCNILYVPWSQTVKVAKALAFEIVCILPSSEWQFNRVHCAFWEWRISRQDQSSQTVSNWTDTQSNQGPEQYRPIPIKSHTILGPINTYTIWRPTKNQD